MLRAVAWPWSESTTIPLSSASGEAWSYIVRKTYKLLSQIEDELFADLNTPGALGHLFSFIREVNRVEAQSAGKSGAAAPASKERKQVAEEYLRLLETLHRIPDTTFHGAAPRGCDSIHLSQGSLDRQYPRSSTREPRRWWSRRVSGKLGMATQVNSERFLEMVTKSRLVAPESLEKFTRKLREKYGENLPADA
jgi:hypothetical protein